MSITKQQANDKFNEFHAEWTRSIGTPGYDKQLWKLREVNLIDEIKSACPTPLNDLVQVKRIQQAEEHHRMFHRLWTLCVGTPDYNKEHWRQIEIQLIQAKIIR